MSSDTDQNSSAPAFPENSPWLIAAYLLAAAVTVFSVGRMVWAVLAGFRLQYADYWRMVESLLLPDGSLNLAGLFNFSNHHFIAFPQFLYWLNIELFAGSNIALGLIDVLIVCCTLGLFLLIVQRSSLEKPLGIAIMGLTAALLFGLSGAWNFIYGMSGAAWLSANLFVVAAIYLRALDRNRSAVVAAVLATMSYGTGLFVWPAIVAVGVVRRPVSQWWREWPYVSGLVISAAVVTILSKNSGDTSSSDYVLIAQLAATFLGNSVGLSGGWALAAGWVVLLGTPLCGFWLALFVKSQRDAPWVGLALYGWCAILVITQGRAVFMTVYGYQGRYYSIGALTWLGFTVMLILTLRSLTGIVARRSVRNGSTAAGAVRGDSSNALTAVSCVLVVLLTIAALVSSNNELEKRDRQVSDQQLKEIALHLDAVDGRVGYLEGFTNNTKPFDSTRRLEIAGHYPFVEDWNLDCGLLGKKLPEFSAQQRRGGTLRNVAMEKGLNSVSRISGIIPGEATVNGSIQCVLVADPEGAVVGVGALRPRKDGAKKQHFTALAHEIEGSYKVYFFDDEEEPVLLSGPIATRKRER